LRGKFGIHVAKIAAAFKLDVEDRLASILPANANADTGDDDRQFRKLYLKAVAWGYFRRIAAQAARALTTEAKAEINAKSQRRDSRFARSASMTRC